MKLFSVLCPIHNKEIGEIKWDLNGEIQLGFWCPKCGKHIRFDKETIKKHLISGLFPEKIINN